MPKVTILLFSYNSYIDVYTSQDEPVTMYSMFIPREKISSCATNRPSM